MGKSIKDPVGAHEIEPVSVSLSELIHQHVRVAIETAVHEELRVVLGTTPYERSEVRRGYRNGTKERTLRGPTGPVALTVPRATLFNVEGAKERRWSPHTWGGQHPPDSQCAPTAAQDRSPLEERGVACRSHLEGRSGGMADAFARRP
jgi:hypothetical protein